MTFEQHSYVRNAIQRFSDTRYLNNDSVLLSRTTKHECMCEHKEEENFNYFYLKMVLFEVNTMGGFSPSPHFWCSKIQYFKY